MQKRCYHSLHCIYVTVHDVYTAEVYSLLEYRKETCAGTQKIQKLKMATEALSEYKALLLGLYIIIP